MWSVFINRTAPDAKFGFSDLLDLQEKTLAEISPSSGSALLFAEVTPTVTLGARQMHDPSQLPHLEALRARLQAKGVELSSGERGGKETWHGPGQWVGFVLTPLEAFTGEPRAVRKAVYQILNLVLAVVRQYQPEARIEEGDRLGIWSPKGKLVSIGIKIRGGYITSGFALNCYRHPLSFYGIDPCGLSGAIPDFLFEGTPSPVSDPEFEFQCLPSLLSRQFFS